MCGILLETAPVYAKKVREARNAKHPYWPQPFLAKTLAGKKALGLTERQWLDLVKNIEYDRREAVKPEEIGAIAEALGIQQRWFDEPDGSPIRWTHMPSNATIEPEKPQEHVPNIVPYWGIVPCGNWERPENDEEARIKVSDEIEDVRGVIAVRVGGNSMLPAFHPNEIISIRRSQTPLNGVVTLARNEDGELTLKKMVQVGPDEWELHSLNPLYGTASAAGWEILGHAVWHEGGDMGGIRV